jgi:hypothetical protein
MISEAFYSGRMNLNAHRHRLMGANFVDDGRGIVLTCYGQLVEL